MNKKNIWVIPTDKPSRLYEDVDNDLQLGYDFTIRQGMLQNQNIYITSDEEIKEGVDQWYLDKVLNKPYNSSGAQYSSKQDVIIMTTDQDLIADGVQSINDEFLEWLVNNPSCENVKVNVFMNREYECGDDGITGFAHFCTRQRYKIIIPMEENKDLKN